MIRHAGLAAAFAVVSLPVAVVEAAFRALLMPAIGGTSLPTACLLPAQVAAIALAVVAIGAEEEQRAAIRQQTKPLSQNRFARRRHAGCKAVLDNGLGFVAG
jgi:hypothetical protein